MTTFSGILSSLISFRRLVLMPSRPVGRWEITVKFKETWIMIKIPSPTVVQDHRVSAHADQANCFWTWLLSHLLNQGWYSGFYQLEEFLNSNSKSQSHCIWPLRYCLLFLPTSLSYEFSSSAIKAVPSAWWKGKPPAASHSHSTPSVNLLDPNKLTLISNTV